MTRSRARNAYGLKPLEVQGESMVAVNDMTIGALALRAQCTVPTIRYYEEIGLLRKAKRRMGGHRMCDDADLQV